MKKHIIYGCPNCKEYLPKNASYNYCIYCKYPYDSDKLIILTIIKNKENLLEK